MNERQERTADVLGKLTVLSTIVLPMNLVTGMFGANFRVPGDQGDDLWWFYGTTAFLALFGLVSYWVAKRVYGLV
jgi:magnesium transporter